MDLTPLVSLFTLFASMSVAVERVIEILKGILPPLAKQQADVTREYIRSAILHLLSFFVGWAIAAISKIDISSMLKLNAGACSHDFWCWRYVVVGLLASGGSAFWNHLLDMVKAAKIQKESDAAATAKTAGNTNPIPA